jgi:hypothetical protein
LLLLLVPIGAWLVVATLPWADGESPALHRFCRDLGYVVLAALIVPYLYIWRRLSLHQHFGHMVRWMRWHIAAAYLAFGLMVVHARGHLFRGALTTWVVILFAVVMLSGMLGLVIQKTVFRLLALTQDEELGLQRLHDERQSLIAKADRLVTNYSMLTAADFKDWRGFCSKLVEEKSKANVKIWKKLRFVPRLIVRKTNASPADAEPNEVVIAAINKLLRTDKFCRPEDFVEKDFHGMAPWDEVNQGQGLRRPAEELTDSEIERRNRLYLELACNEHIAWSRKPPATVARFFEERVARYLRSEFPSWSWLFRGSTLEPVSRNHYQQVRALVAPEQAGMIDQLWEWVEQRRRMDLEYWLHRLARAWLWLHGPAAWPLLVLVLYHVFRSIYYGGFF